MPREIMWAHWHKNGRLRMTADMDVHLKDGLKWHNGEDVTAETSGLGNQRSHGDRTAGQRFRGMWVDLVR